MWLSRRCLESSWLAPLTAHEALTWIWIVALCEPQIFFLLLFNLRYCTNASVLRVRLPRCPWARHQGFSCFWAVTANDVDTFLIEHRKKMNYRLHLWVFLSQRVFVGLCYLSLVFDSCKTQAAQQGCQAMSMGLYFILFNLSFL